MNDYFAIYIEPVEPVILGRRLNLDAILAFQLLQRLRAQGIDEIDAIQRANQEIPLAQMHDVFAASSALVPYTRITKRTYFGSLQKHVAGIPDFAEKIEKNRRTTVSTRDFDKIEGAYRNLMTTFDAYHLHRPNFAAGEDDHNWGIWFAAYGDREAVEELLSDFHYIGAKRTPIKPVEYFEADPPDVPGLLGHGGQVLRPFPTACGLAPRRHYSRSHERYRPPYWRSEFAIDPVLCYVPPQVMWSNEPEIRKMIGVI